MVVAHHRCSSWADGIVEFHDVRGHLLSNSRLFGACAGLVSSHELGSTAIAARACFAKGAISHFHYGAPGCSDIVES
jgi:hypothetical protein